jgi:rubrerythrin
VRLTELHQDLVALRTDLAEELLAINRLESQTFDLVDDEVREELRRLADEKKGHAWALLALLQRLDPKFGPRTS